MLKWFKDALVQRLVEEVRLNARRYDKLISAILGLNTAINNLERKVNEFMATQEERLQAIFGQLTGVKAGINTLIEQLATLKSNNPTIEDEISAIEGTVKDMHSSLPGVPSAEPTPESAPEG